MIREPNGLVHEYNHTARELLGLSREHFGVSGPSAGWRLIWPSGADLAPAEYPSSVARATGCDVHGCVLGVVQPGGAVVWTEWDAHLHPRGRITLRFVVCPPPGSEPRNITIDIA